HHVGHALAILPPPAGGEELLLLGAPYGGHGEQSGSAPFLPVVRATAGAKPQQEPSQRVSPGGLKACLTLSLPASIPSAPGAPRHERLWTHGRQVRRCE